MTYEREIEITIAIKPTARLSFISSVSIFSTGVMNSKIKYAIIKIKNPYAPHSSCSYIELLIEIENRKILHMPNIFPPVAIATATFPFFISF